MRVKKKYLWLRILLFLVLLFWMHWLYLFSYPGLLQKIYNQEAYRYFLGWLSLFVFLGTNLLYPQKLKKFGNLIPFFWLYLMCYVVQILYTILVYDEQSIVSTLHVGAPFLIPLLVPAVLIVLTDEQGLQSSLKIVDVITFLWSVVLIYQNIQFQTNRGFAFDFQSYFTTGVTFRDGNLRLSLGAIANMYMVYRIYKLFYGGSKGIKKLYEYIALIAGVYSLVIIQQTRMYTLIHAIVFIVLLLCSGKSNKIKIMSTLATGILVYLLFTSNVVSEFLLSFSTNSDKGISTLTRLYAIQYYIQCFLKNPLLGNGLTSEIVYPEIEHSASGLLYYVDVGIFGLLAQVGLCAVVFYIIPLFNMCKTAYCAVKYTRTWQIDIALCIYLILTSFSLLQIHPVQVLAYVMSFSYFEYRKHEIQMIRNRRQTYE